MIQLPTRRRSSLRFRSAHVRAVLGLIIMAAGPLIGSAAEPKAGSPLTVAVRGRGGPVTMRFRYCPPGKVRPGAPKSDEPGAPPGNETKKGSDPVAAALDDAVSLSPFFISETEITIPQFRALLGGDRLGEVLKRFPNLQSAADLKKMAESGAEYPIYLASLKDATDFSEALQSLYASEAAHDSGGIIAYRFRIPTHDEWQYACRAVADVASQQRLPHFNGWPDGIDALDRNTRESCREEWKKLGRPDREEFAGTQEQVVFLLENSKSGESLTLKILSAFLKAGIGTERDYSLNRPGKVSLAGSTKKANAWGLYDMHENVHEWVIATGSERADSLLRGLTNPSSLSAADRQEKLFLLAGGSFNALMTGSSSGWKTFTIWGSKPSDTKGIPSKFSLDEEGPAHAKTQEYEPGFRVVMRRALADAWLLAVRQDAVLTKTLPPDTLARLRTKRAAAIEVASSAQSREVVARMAFYEGLAQYRMGQRAESGASIRAARNALPAHSRGRRASRLASAFGDDSHSPSERPAAPRLPAEEELYLDTLAGLIEQDR